MSAAGNIEWVAESPAGPLEITINRAKPEKDPRAIAAAACAGSGGAVRGQGASPASQADGGAAGETCPLCWERADADGAHSGSSARAHLVASGAPVTPVMLGGETWAWWFSPYGYFPEHLIAASPGHRPMAITHGTVERLLDFADTYPRWFIGSNAELPLVGGSLLAHDHFQGGGHRFPLMKAPVERTFPLPGLPRVEAGIVRWPASVVRLRGADRASLYAGACRVMDAWRVFDDEACGIRSHTIAPGGAPVPYSTLNPILWREGGDYVCDLVLRNNRTTPERPWGLFHVPERLFHIKKENIGLIEVMGRAILPGRLAAEWPGVRPACESAFYEILQAVGVFKQDETGRAGWDRFIATL